MQFYTQTLAQLPAVQAANRFEVLMNVAATGLAWPRMTPFHVAHNYMRRISEDVPPLSSSSQAAISGQVPPPTVPQAYGRRASSITGTAIPTPPRGRGQPQSGEDLQPFAAAANAAIGYARNSGAICHATCTLHTPDGVARTAATAKVDLCATVASTFTAT